MLRKSFFMDGETLMVSMKPDPSTTVTRAATEEEGADYTTQEGPKPAKSEPVPSDSPEDGTPAKKAKK